MSIFWSKGLMRGQAYYGPALCAHESSETSCPTMCWSLFCTIYNEICQYYHEPIFHGAFGWQNQRIFVDIVGTAYGNSFSTLYRRLGSS